jgi:hypothetical protein
MKLRTLVAACFAILILFPRCKTGSYAQKEKEEMDHWIGHSKAELIDQLGPPQNSYPDGLGGEILIYKKADTISYNMPATFNSSAGATFSNSFSGSITYSSSNMVTVIRVRMFDVNSKGTIFHWMVKTDQG